MNEPLPGISIGIMTRDYGQYVVAAIESVLAQTYTNWELLISDDGSKDNTPELVAPYLADPRIRYAYHETPLGQSANWTYVLMYGRAPLAAVLHADDTWLPETLQTVVDRFAADPELDVYTANWRVIRGTTVAEHVTIRDRPSDTLTGRAAYERCIVYNTFLPSCTFIKRSLFDSAGLPSPNFNYLVDFEYSLRLFWHARFVHWDAQPRTLYRSHAASATSNPQSSSKWVREYLSLPPLVASSELARENRRRTLYHIGLTCTESLRAIAIRTCLLGDWPTGKRFFDQAQTICPISQLWLRVMIDRMLCRLGLPGRALFKKLHAPLDQL
jgi:glycosyltransferase involved in cell wall biosynthesis